MDVDLIFKIAAVGILLALLNQLLVRSGPEEPVRGWCGGQDELGAGDQRTVPAHQDPV